MTMKKEGPSVMAGAWGRGVERGDCGPWGRGPGGCQESRGQNGGLTFSAGRGPFSAPGALGPVPGCSP